MTELMQSTEMPHESGEEQSFDAVPMSETEIGAMFDEPEAESDEPVTEQPEEEDAPEAEEAAPEEPPIPAPSNWSELDKEEFEKLPRPVQEKIVAREKERDAYLTRKTQEIAEKSRSVQSLEVLGEALRNDPGLRAHLEAYQRQEAAQPEPPADPIERIAWEAEQRALAKVQEQLAPVMQQMQHKQAIDATLAIVNRDPHKDAVYGEIGKMLEALPPALRQQTYQRLDSDPQFFSTTYDHYRQQVTSRPAPAKEAEAPAPTPVERKTKAPRLEAPGAEPPKESSKKRFKELSSRARSGDLDALGALFDL
jgi:hypothetical protein